MKQIITRTAIFMSGILAGIIVISLLAFNDRESKNTRSNAGDEHNWYAPALPTAMDFAGEPVPLQRWEVKEQLDREVLLNYYRPEAILYMLKLSGRYFPLIESRLKANGIPDDFKYLCIVESNMMNAISRVGATGFWQFMRGTAPSYGLEISSSVDERYNVLKSTDAACKYLKQAFDKFGSWTAAAASYNCGMGGYQTQANFQQSNDYYDLILLDETQRYIFRILAFKYLMTKSDELGFKLKETERYTPIPTKTITVSSSIPNLVSFAKEHGTSYKLLKWLNPWLRSRSLHVKPGKTYTLILPD